MLDQLTSGWYFLLRMPLIPRTIEEARTAGAMRIINSTPSQSSALKITISQSHRFRGFAVFSRHQFELGVVQLNECWTCSDKQEPPR